MQYVQLNHFSDLAVRRDSLFTQLRHTGIQVLVRVFLVLQAAHQPSAGTGDLGRIQGQILLLCHLDGNRLELPKECRTAQLSSADPDAAQHSGLVSHANLAQLDPHVEDSRQVLDQAAEVHTSIRGEVEQHLGSVKGILRIHHLHVKLMLTHLLAADLERFLLLALECFDSFLVLRRRLAHKRAQRLLDKLLIHHLHAGGYNPEVQPLGGLCDHMVSHPQLQILRIKIIHLSRAAESDSYNLYHKTITSFSSFCFWLLYHSISDSMRLFQYQTAPARPASVRQPGRKESKTPRVLRGADYPVSVSVCREGLYTLRRFCIAFRATMTCMCSRKNSSIPVE